MTNGEEIRAMADGKLALVLCDLFYDCADCPFEELCTYGKNGALEWLKQEKDTGN